MIKMFFNLGMIIYEIIGCYICFYLFIALLFFLYLVGVELASLKFRFFFFMSLFGYVILMLYTEFQSPTMPGIGVGKRFDRTKVRQDKGSTEKSFDRTKV